MPSTPSKPILLLLGVALAMSALVGLVGSARRQASRPIELAPDPWRPGGRSAGTVLVAPAPAPPDAPAPAAAPAAPARPAKAAESKAVRATGLVLRPDGEPAAGARLALGGQRAECDTGGRFQLAFSAGAEGDDLVAHLPGFEPAVRPRFGSSPGGEHEVRLVLGPETLALAGTVATADGTPLAGWTVELDGPDLLRDYGLREVLRTDDGGRFVLGDVPAGVHVLRAWKSRPERAFRSSPAAAGEQGLTIVAEPDD